MPLLTIGDVSLHYRTSFKTNPDPHKPCVLLIHPVFMSTSFFDNMFQDTRTCAILNLIAFDLPYHGSTTVNSSAFTTSSDSFPLKETAEILADALKTLEIDHVNILGVSHMGLVGCELAGGWPEMVDSFVYAGVVEPQEGEFARSEFQAMFAAALKGDENDQSVMPREVMEGFMHALLNDGIYVLSKAKKEEWFQRWNELYRPSSNTALTKCFQLLLTRPVTPSAILKSITCPVMLLHGALDFLYPLSVADAFLTTIPNAPRRELCEIERGCHWAYYAPGAIPKAIKFWVSVASAKRAREGGW